jgi:MFS family permease
MLSPLANPTYARLFGAQILSLLGTGLMTVALGLLAFDLAGADAGVVLGTALAIKMVAYVGVAPVAGAFVHLVPRRTLLVALDLLRAGVALALPLVTEVWQVFVLIALLQSCSAAFTPTFQATIPDVLPEEAEYTRALSLSRLAYDTEALVSPMLAAALLSVIGFHWLFAATVLGFIASAALVMRVVLPAPAHLATQEGVWARTTRGVRLYLATPRLRGLLAINLAAAAAGAMVIVNTVVLVRAGLALGDAELAWTLAAYGGGSMFAALLLPRVLDRLGDRPVMLAGGAVLGAGLLLGPVILREWPLLLALWAVLGFGNGLALTPSGRLLRRSAEAGDRPALFAAQFALSHACWLLTYPLAGWAGANAGLPATFVILAALAIGGLLTAARVWPAAAEEPVLHEHRDMPSDHPHLAGAEALPSGGFRHAHAAMADGLHAMRAG